MKFRFAILLAGAPLWAQAPLAQPQPNAVTYPLTALNLFPTYNRASYTQTTGLRAAPCDPTQPLKLWFDSTVANVTGGSATYQQIGTKTDGSATLLSYVLPASIATAVNLPGVETFPPYTLAPTDAYSTDSSGVPLSPVPANRLSTMAQANAIAAALGASSVIEESFGTAGSSFRYVYPADETRRLYDVVTTDGNSLNVGFLLQQELYKNGVGAPGHWVNTGPSPGMGWEFALDAYPDCLSVTQTRPVPVRALLPNEIFTMISAGFSSVAAVERTDLQAQADQASPNWTLTDRATLNHILTLLQGLTGKQ